MRHLLAVALVAVYTAGARAQTVALDLIPADATIAIVVRHPEELRKKGDDFFKETNLNNLGFRPTDLLAMAANFLGITQGLDYAGPAGGVLLRPANAPKNFGLEDLDKHLYVFWSFTELDKMAANFGFAEGALKPGTVAKVPKENRPFGQHVLVQGKQMFLAGHPDVLERLRKARPVGDLSSAQRRSFGKADILVHLNPQGYADDWTGLTRLVIGEFDKLDDPEEKESVAHFVKTLESLRFALAGVTVDGGLGINFHAAFARDKSDAVKQFLGSLRATSEVDLRGLPDGRVIAAQAYSGAGARNSILARALFNFVLKNTLETTKITSAADRPSFVGVFSEVWRRLEGSRVGAYLTGDESKQGLFSLVAVLDTKDPEQFLAEMRTLAKMADGTLDLSKKQEAAEIDMPKLVRELADARYPVRTAATTRLRLIGEPALAHLEKAVANPSDLETARRAQLLVREISAVAAERRKELLAKDLPRYVRPTFAWVAKAETRGNVPVDIVHIKLVDKDLPALKQMQQYFGPEWDRLRLAVVGKQIVVLLGSEVELFETAIANVKDGKPGLAASKVTAGFDKIRAKGATAGVHMSVENLLALVGGQPRRLEDLRLTSFGLSVQDAGLQLDLFVPVADIRAIEKQRPR